MSGWDKFILSPLKAPCRGCDKRSARCHSICEEYKAFYKANEKMQEEKLRKAKITQTLYNNTIDRNTKLSSRQPKIKHGRRGA